jgi:hypothetical protein
MNLYSCKAYSEAHVYKSFKKSLKKVEIKWCCLNSHLSLLGVKQCFEFIFHFS